MKGQPWLLLILAIAFFVIMVVVLSEGDQAGSATFSLRPPHLADAVYASSMVPSMDVAARIKGEAGISAYCKTPSNLELSKLAAHFTTIEVETADYLLGSVSVPDYPEIYDPHIYAHKSGWVLAYYLHHEPIGKIIDVKAQDITHTKLENVITQVLDWADVPAASITHYHFQHPDATHMMFIAETYDSGDNQFFIQFPLTFIYLERSWALGDTGGGKYFKINGVDQVAPAETDGQNREWHGTSGYGNIAVNSLLPNEMHAISVDEYGVLVLLYQAPE